MKRDEAVVYDFCTELHRTRRVSDARYRRALALLGEHGAMDLIGACGYYTLVSMTLNVARVPVPAGEKIPLRRLRR
jgi:4-carboxymuconolactone decarboxylase